MMVEITFQMVLSTLQTAGLLVGIFYYIMTLRNAQKSRDAQIFLQFSNKTGTKNWHNGINHIRQLKFSSLEELRKYRENNPDEWFDIRYVFGVIEDFGGLVRGGYLNINIIAITSSTNIIRAWEMLQPIIDEMRRVVGDPRTWSEMEYLYNQVILFNKKRYPKLYK